MDGRTVIRSLRMENFGCFKDRQVEFDAGISQLVGPNESGKSTILEALFTVLYESGATRKKTVSARQAWSQDQPIRLTLVFSVGEKTFTLTRDYGTGHDHMLDSDGLVYEGKTIDEKLTLYFGTADRSLYEAVFCFSSDFPDAPEKHRSRLQSALETPIFFGFDRRRADSWLDEEIKKLENPRAHGPRELDLLDEQITTAIQNRNGLEEKLTALDKDAGELTDVRQKLEEHEDEVIRLEGEIAGAEAYQQLNLKMDNLEERLQLHLANFSRASQLADDLERVQKENRRLQAPGNVELQNLKTRRDDMAEAVDSSKHLMDTLIARRSIASYGFLGATLILAIVCLVYILEQNGSISTGAATEYIPYAVPVMAVIWLAQLGSYVGQIWRKKTVTTRFRTETAGLDAFYAELNSTYDLMAADPIQALDDIAMRKEFLENSVANLRDTIDHLSEGNGLDYLQGIIQQIEKEVAQINKDLSPLVPYADALNNLRDLKEKVTAKRVRANALRERAAHLAERCSGGDALREDLANLDADIEMLKRKHVDLTERLEVLKITRMALNHAADHLIEDTFVTYGEEISARLSELTDGRYSQVRFSRDTGRFEVNIDAAGGWLEIDTALSSSTRDAVYLAVRMAAAERIGEFAPPVFFDQAEARMDNNRRKLFFDALARLSETRQVLFVSIKTADDLPSSHVVACEPDWHPVEQTSDR